MNKQLDYNHDAGMSESSTNAADIEVKIVRNFFYFDFSIIFQITAKIDPLNISQCEYVSV